MFTSLTEKLQDTFKKLRGKGKLTEKDIDAAIRELRVNLLEADVNFKVVKKLMSNVKERAVGHEVMKSLTPAQQIVKILREELTAMLEQEDAGLNTSSEPPTVILLAGLQGSGKTTTAAKLANHLRSNGHRPMLIGADLTRPGAVDQLSSLASKEDISFFSEGKTPEEVAQKGLKQAKKSSNDLVIVDTSGRLHIDDELMEELSTLREKMGPSETLLVVDAMTGQDAVNIASDFNERIGISGVILTKLDGDARGGAALSVKAATGCPVKFAGVGEKIEDLEPFYPERMVKRILGMGDVLSLIEKAENTIDQEKAKEMEDKLRSQQFTLEDFKDQLHEIKKMGSIQDMLDMLPSGMGGVPSELKNLSVGDDQVVKTEAIINSMTPEERRDPSIINSSRRKRIARGSGTRVQDVNQLLKQFDMMKKMMKKMGGMDKKKAKKKGIKKLPFFQ